MTVGGCKGGGGARQFIRLPSPQAPLDLWQPPVCCADVKRMGESGGGLLRLDG